MTLNDRRELPSEHKEREEQTNDDKNLDNCVHYFVRAHVMTYWIKVTVFGPLLPFLHPLSKERKSKVLLGFC